MTWLMLYYMHHLRILLLCYIQQRSLLTIKISISFSLPGLREIVFSSHCCQEGIFSMVGEEEEGFAVEAMPVFTSSSAVVGVACGAINVRR
mmetsp:Transcript_43447/g.71060  ORF Transcript_43447/g.71060 Transcript_43447/m.71060 type:complete len:91 (-) Transcript_43447:157-429(-)